MTNYKPSSSFGVDPPQYKEKSQEPIPEPEQEPIPEPEQEPIPEPEQEPIPEPEQEPIPEPEQEPIPEPEQEPIPEPEQEPIPEPEQEPIPEPEQEPIPEPEQEPIPEPEQEPIPEPEQEPIPEPEQEPIPEPEQEPIPEPEQEPIPEPEQEPIPEPEQEPIPLKKPKKNPAWLFPTNTDNMRSVIAQGLISSPEGFKKYYEDALTDHEGVIPVFKNKIPISVIDKSLSLENMVVCIIELNLKLIEGKVFIEIDNKLQEIDISEALEGNDSAIYIPSPLPTSLINNIFFKTKDDRNRFEIDANSYSNVPLVDLDRRLKLKKSLFKNKLKYEKPQGNNLNDQMKPDYSRIYAFGGIAALLFYFAKNGSLSNKLYKSFVHLDHSFESESSKPDDLNICFKSITSSDKPAEKSTVKEILYFGLLKTIIESKENIKQNILSFLEDYEGDDRAKKRTQDITKSLENLDFSDKTIPELFEEAKGLEKILIMFFLRKNSEELIEFDAYQLDEKEFLIFSIFFGARDNFKGIPKFIREYHGLQIFITTQMANYAHETIGSGISFRPAKVEPKTFMDMMSDSTYKDYNKFIKHIYRER